MFFELLFLVVACLLLWLTIQWGKTKNFWSARGVPHNPPHPIYGSLTFLQKENPAYFMNRLYKQFKSPYVGIWLFWRPGLVINSPEIAKRILVKDSDNFRNRFMSSGKSDPIGALNLVTANDPLWSNVRRRLTPVFTAAKLRSLEGLISEKVSDLIRRIHEESKKNPKETNIRHMNTDYSTDVIGEAAFGVRSQSTLTGDSAMRKITRDFMQYSFLRGLAWSSIFFFPELVDVFGFSFFPKDTTGFLRKLFVKIVEQRGGFEKEVKEPKDLLDALVKLKQEATLDKEEITEDVIVAQAAIFLQAGFDTTASTLTWAYNELAHAPHVQDRLYNELVGAREKHGKKLDSKTLAEIPYLNAVLKETMRKFNPMGWHDRIAAKDYQIDDKLTIPAGTVIYINAYGMMWDPENFPEPEVFNPDRFLPENEKNIKPYTYMPFGEAPRNCIGMRFAYLSMRYALSEVVLSFTLRPVAGAAPPNECSVDKRGMLLMPDKKISIAFVPRDTQTLA